jgi:hypothetical protein
VEYFQGSLQPGDLILEYGGFRSKEKNARTWFYTETHRSNSLNNVTHHWGIDLTTGVKDYIFSEDNGGLFPGERFTIVRDSVEYCFREDPGYP